MTDKPIGRKIFLLPGIFKYIGLLLLFAGFIFGTIRFWYGIKLQFLNFTVPAIYSFYLQGKYFQWIENNFGEEIPAVLIYAGLFCIVLSKEKIENELVNFLRLRSFTQAFIFNSVFVLALNIFFYGFGFIDGLIFHLFSLPLAYIILFRTHILLHKAILIPGTTAE